MAAVPMPVPSASSPLLRAIEAALASKPGLALEVGYEDETEKGVRREVIEVMVLDASGAAIEVVVDPVSGRVLEAGPSDEADEAAELGALAKGLPGGHLPLAELVRRASVDGGTPREAAFKVRSGSPTTCVVRLQVGAQSKRIALDPVTGTTRDVPQRTEADDDEKDEPEGKAR
ncbi:MAG: PepSY domain-containing protein [Planctomycetes bacterium]|nr:PepSY domain-containing protein [Planctomycetota bacterium]